MIFKLFTSNPWRKLLDLLQKPETFAEKQRVSKPITPERTPIYGFSGPEDLENVLILLHILRNPYGWSEEDVRAVRLAAADRIDKGYRTVPNITAQVTRKPTAAAQELRAAAERVKQRLGHDLFTKVMLDAADLLEQPQQL